MHSLTVHGRVGSVKPLHTVGENSVLNFTLASTEFGSKEKQTVWFQCEMWGEHAVNIVEWITVGKGLFVTGYLVPDENGNPSVYTSKDGTPKASFRLNVQRIEFTSPKSEAKTTTEDEIPF